MTNTDGFDMHMTAEPKPVSFRLGELSSAYQLEIDTSDDQGRSVRYIVRRAERDLFEITTIKCTKWLRKEKMMRYLGRTIHTTELYRGGVLCFSTSLDDTRTSPRITDWRVTSA